MRPEVEANAILPLGFGFALLGFFAFAYLYAQGYQGGGVAEGIQFGLLAGVILCCFGTIWDYMVWPVSPTLAAFWMIDYMLEFALYGAIVGALYQPASSAISRADEGLRLGAGGWGLAAALARRSAKRGGG